MEGARGSRKIIVLGRLGEMLMSIDMVVDIGQTTTRLQRLRQLLRIERISQEATAFRWIGVLQSSKRRRNALQQTQ